MEGLKIMATNELQVQQPEPLWLVKPCNTTGCSVMIRIPIAQASTVHNCRWCLAQGDYNTDTAKVRPQPVNGPFLSKEEFGVDIFEAIRLQAGYRQAEKTAEIYGKKGLKKLEREYRDAAKALNLQLQEILKKNTIGTTDLKRIWAIT